MSRALIDVRLQTRAIDAGRQMERLSEQDLPAVAAFAARLSAGDDVHSVLIDHHPVLARSEMIRIAEEAERLWSLRAIILIHRHGTVEADALVQFVGVAADAADLAQPACAWIAQALRSRPPFWRKDLLTDGGARWHGR